MDEQNKEEVKKEKGFIDQMFDGKGFLDDAEDDKNEGLSESLLDDSEEDEEESFNDKMFKELDD